MAIEVPRAECRHVVSPSADDDRVARVSLGVEHDEANRQATGEQHDQRNERE
jgi:hypothetical protein